MLPHRKTTDNILRPHILISDKKYLKPFAFTFIPLSVCGVALHGVLWHAVWYAKWNDMVCYVAWHGVVCYVAWHGIICYMAWYVICFGMVYDVIYYMIWYGIWCMHIRMPVSLLSVNTAETTGANHWQPKPPFKSQIRCIDKTPLFHPSKWSFTPGQTAPWLVRNL